MSPGEIRGQKMRPIRKRLEQRTPSTRDGVNPATQGPANGPTFSTPAWLEDRDRLAPDPHLGCAPAEPFVRQSEEPDWDMRRWNRQLAQADGQLGVELGYESRHGDPTHSDDVLEAFDDLEAVLMRGR